MAATWIAGTAYTASGTFATTVTANAPAGVTTGDVLLACIYYRGYGGLIVPSGWTLIAETTTSGGSAIPQVAVLQRDSASASDASASFSFSINDTISDPSPALTYALLRDSSGLVSASAGTFEELSYPEHLDVTPASIAATADGQMLLVVACAEPNVASQSPTPPTSHTLWTGASSVSPYRLAGAYRAVNTGQSNSGVFRLTSTSYPDLEFTGTNSLTLLMGATGGIPAVEGYTADGGPLRPPQALGIQPQYSVATAAPSVLGAAAPFAIHDFSAAVDGLRSRYVMDLTTSGGTVRVPISSWQATLQTDAANYLQCVVPAVSEWVDDLQDATAFAISRAVTLADGRTLEYQMASSTLDTLSLAQGVNNYTATISGYTEGIAAPTGSSTDRTLGNVRTVFTSSAGLRIRCDVDWLLRPGQVAIYEGTPFLVKFLNYYGLSDDVYMDVGENVETE